MWQLQPPLKKVTPLFSSKPLLKVEVLSSSPLFENLVGGSIPYPLSPFRKRGGGGVHIMTLLYSIFKTSLLRHTLKTLIKLLIKLKCIYASYYVPKISKNSFTIYVNAA